MGVVVDASVAIKWFVEEPGSNRARLLWRDTPGLTAPDILVAEVGNAAWKKVRRGEIGPRQAEAIAARLAAGVVEYRRTDALVPRAMAIALALGHPIYDCFYLALAEHEGSLVVTADQRLSTRLAGSPLARLFRRI